MYSLKMISKNHSRVNFIENLQQPAPQVLAQLAPFTVVCINLEITKNCCGLLKLVHMILIYCIFSWSFLNWPKV